jgi:hypothetical protein
MFKTCADSIKNFYIRVVNLNLMRVYVIAGKTEKLINVDCSLIQSTRYLPTRIKFKFMPYLQMRLEIPCLIVQPADGIAAFIQGVSCA